MEEVRFVELVGLAPFYRAAL